VQFSGGSAVGGLTLNGTFTVTGVTNSDHFTFTAGSAASSGAKGGGTVTLLATQSGASGGSSVTVRHAYSIKPSPNGLERIVANTELNDIDSSGPYGLNDATRLALLLPTTLSSSNAASIVTNANTLHKNTATVRNQLQIDKTKFDFYANIADPQGSIDSELRKLNTELNKLFEDAEQDGRNLVAEFASDIEIKLNSGGKKLTITAQDTIKEAIKGKLDQHYYSVLDGEGGSITTLGASPFATANGSSTVTVTQANHDFDVDDFVSFRAISGTDVNGVNLNKTFRIASVSNGTYTVIADNAATATGSGGGTVVEVSDVSGRVNDITDAKFLASRALSKLKAERFALNIELSILKGQLSSKPELETQFLNPLKNTDYAKRFIEKYLIIQDLASAGAASVSTNNNALAIDLIKNISPSNGLGLSVNFLS
jgi:hypothetical protein